MLWNFIVKSTVTISLVLYYKIQHKSVIACYDIYEWQPSSISKQKIDKTGGIIRLIRHR